MRGFRHLQTSEQVITPVDTRVLMRPIMTMQEAEAFVASLSSLEAESTAELSQRAAREHYQAIVTSYDCKRIAAFMKCLCCKRAAAIKHGKKVSQLDERYAKRAEDTLYGELAAALGIAREEVCAYIRRSYAAWLAD